MKIDKNDPAGPSDVRAEGQIETLESSEIEGVDLETVVGGTGGEPNTFYCGTTGCKKG